MPREIAVGKCILCGIVGWHTLRDCVRLSTKLSETNNQVIGMKEDEMSREADSQNLSADKMDPTKVEAITSPGQKKVVG